MQTGERCRRCTHARTMSYYGSFVTADNSCSCWDTVCFALHTSLALVIAAVLQKGWYPLVLETSETQAQTFCSACWMISQHHGEMSRTSQPGLPGSQKQRVPALPVTCCSLAACWCTLFCTTSRNSSNHAKVVQQLGQLCCDQCADKSGVNRHGAEMPKIATEGWLPICFIT